MYSARKKGHGNFIIEARIAQADAQSARRMENERRESNRGIAGHPFLQRIGALLEDHRKMHDDIIKVRNHKNHSTSRPFLEHYSHVPKECVRSGYPPCVPSDKIERFLKGNFCFSDQDMNAICLSYGIVGDAMTQLLDENRTYTAECRERNAQKAKEVEVAPSPAPVEVAQITPEMLLEEILKNLMRRCTINVKGDIGQSGQYDKPLTLNLLGRYEHISASERGYFDGTLPKIGKKRSLHEDDDRLAVTKILKLLGADAEELRIGMYALERLHASLRKSLQPLNGNGESFVAREDAKKPNGKENSR